VIIIGISSNMCSLDISVLSHVNDGHKALICFRCLHLIWNQMDKLVVNKEKTQKANIISTEMWPQICYKFKIPQGLTSGTRAYETEYKIKQALGSKIV
jgi:hypothetical protein